VEFIEKFLNIVSYF